MDPVLEQAQATILGGIIARPAEAASVFSTVRIEDFDQQYRLIAEAIHGLRVARVPIDSLAVVDEASRRGTLSRIGGMAEVARIAGFNFGSVEYAVQVLARTAHLRRLWAASTRGAQRAEQPDADPGQLAAQLIQDAQGVLDAVEASADEVITPTVGEFLSAEDPPYDWVIPGLLERGDRLILTGSEGLGKSTAFRQLAVTAAAGLHAFTHQPIPQQRVLYVDCENGPVKLRRAFRGLVAQAKQAGEDPSRSLFVESRPEGLDLTRPEDEAWLVRLVANLQPSMLLTGPVYRLHAKSPNDEEPARAVTRALDRCRAAANCALVLEAHSGHGEASNPHRPVRPHGTSLWLRWPEFGYGLRAAADYDPARRVVDLVAWRGDREERDWPKRLRSGGAWPWEAASTDRNGTWSPSAHAVA